MAKTVTSTTRATRGTRPLVESFTTQLDATPDRYKRDAGLEALAKLSAIVKALPKFKEPALQAAKKPAKPSKPTKPAKGEKRATRKVVAAKRRTAPAKKPFAVPLANGTDHAELEA